ncbi:MAG TPA: hypothetical protein VIF62_35125 [Labilithrix sp.]|jgi:hypothetical protein
MNRQTAATYKRGALFVLPVLAIVGCRVGLRACVFLAKDADMRQSRIVDDGRLAEAQRQAEIANASATQDQKQRAVARSAPSAAAGWQAKPIASAQQVPDALAVDANWVAWLATRSGDVVVAPRAGGAPRVVAKAQKLPLRRHVQGLALGGGYVHWITAGKDDDDGAVMRAKLDGGDPETLISGVGGLAAIAVDDKNVYFARALATSREEDGAATGGVWRLPTGKAEAKLVVAAERPCAIALDDKAVYAAETLQIWRAPKSGGAPKAIVSGGDRLGCSIAVDEKFLYWTIPGDDSLMRAKKADGSSPSALAFLRKRPWNVVVDRGYAYALTETSPQAFGELGSVFRVPLRAEVGTQAAIPEAVVVDRIGLNSVAASAGFVVFADYNESESDGTITAATHD